VPTQYVARADPAGEGQGEVLLCRLGIGKEVDAAGSLVGADLRFRRHLRAPRKEPVCRPALAAINAERESASPAGNSGSGPPANDSVQHTMGAAGKSATSAHGQLYNPVEVELMGGIEIRHRARQIRGKCISQAGSDQADVLVAVDREPDARRGGCDVNGF